MKNYAEYVDYFRRCADAHCDINDFQFGNSEKILSRERSETDYPIMWLEDPTILPEWNDSLSYTFDGSLAVIANAEFDCWQTEAYNLNKMFLIMSDLIKKLVDHSEECEFDLVLKPLDRIHTLGHDNEWGWRLGFQIKCATGHCVDPCKWNDKCPLGALAKFKWKNNIDGGFTDLVIENISKPDDHDYTYEWEWNIDQGTPSTSTDENPTITGTGKWMYICLKITDANGCERCASAYFNCKANAGESVPYCHTGIKPYF